MRTEVYEGILARLGVRPHQGGPPTSPAPQEGAAAPEPRSPPADSREELSEATRLVGMTLAEFERAGRPLEIAVHWAEQTLFFVPTAREAGELAARGVSRGRVWTAAELQDLLSTPGLTRERVRTIGRVKAEFEGRVVEVRE